MSVVDEVKAQLDIVDIVSQTVKLRRTGKNYIGFCPFHSIRARLLSSSSLIAKLGAVLALAMKAGIYFGFVMKREGWDFAETLRYLADKVGVQLSPRTQKNPPPTRATKKLCGKYWRKRFSFSAGKCWKRMKAGKP